MSRKRHRSQAALADEEHNVEHAAGVEINEEGRDCEERREDHDIWVAFKEEHHEILEQLPLSLHRQYTLIRELDNQSEAYHADLLDTLRAYIALRVQLASRLDVSVEAMQHEMNMIVLAASDAKPLQVGSLPPLQPGGSGSSPRDHQVNGDQVSNNAKSTSPTESDTRSLESSSIEPNPIASTSTQNMLQHIAQISEEALGASQEKVNIAQTAYETADRHIRLLDQVIKEQEASITLGIRPGTNLASILLPDLVVPRWARPTRIEHSPTPSLSPEPPVVVLPQESAEELPIESKRPGRGRKTRKKPELCSEIPPPLPEEVQKIPATRTTRSVKLKIPTQTDLEGPQIAADPNEPRYCYCNQVSYGTMIACDNNNCKSEWFHLPCLSEVPNKRQKWYCHNCTLKMTKGKKR